MCGIAGIIALDQSPVAAATATAMASAIVHRGPDGFGTIGQGPVALAHRRLSIIDIDGGAQPMDSSTGRTTIIYNGEAYNYRELARELAPGYAFRNHSDTEVVLAAYERWGAESFSRLHGMYSFALWDRREHAVFLVRDPLGIKPLFFAVQERKLYFASEIKAILTVLPTKPAIRPEAVNAYFARQYIGRAMTIYDGIEVLPPGSFMRIDVKNGTVSTVPFWELKVSPAASETLISPVEDLETSLRAATASHLISDVPVGLFLSGGLDSTVLLALAARESKDRLSTFSVRFAGPRYDESPFARQAAAHFGTDHHELDVDENSALNELPVIMAALDQPLADYAILPTYVMSKFAAQRVKVVLGGEGADELFGGYYWRYLPHLMAEHTGGWLRPKTLRKPMVFADGLRRELLGAAFMPLATLVTEQSLRADLNRYSRLGGLNAALLTDLRHWLPDDLLTKVDAMGMLASLEARVPYLDRAVVEQVASWPAALKLSYGSTKVVLRRLAKRLLPGDLANLANRRKHGFTVPVNAWFRNQLKPRFQELVLAPGPASDWLNRRAVQTLWEQHQAGKNHGLRLWSILTFAWWLEARS